VGAADSGVGRGEPARAAKGRHYRRPLAMASGVSRAPCRRSKCAPQPTLSILWKVAVGLGIPFQALLAPAMPGKAGSFDRETWCRRTSDGRVESRLFDAVRHHRAARDLRASFQAKGVLRSEPTVQRPTKTVILLTGALRVRRGRRDARPRPGDTLFFAPTSPFVRTPRNARKPMLDVIGYGRS